MAATTRELNVKVIFVVTIVSVLLLISIIEAAQAGFFYFQNRQIERQYTRGAERTYEATGLRKDNLDLATLIVEQDQTLRNDQPRDLLNDEGEVVGQAQTMPIEEAMKQIDQRY